MQSSGSLGGLTRSKRGKALIVILALAGGLGIGVLMSLTMHPRTTAAAAQVAISPSTNVIGAPLTRQTTPPLTGLVDQNGTAISLADEKGHVVLLASASTSVRSSVVTSWRWSRRCPRESSPFC